MPAVLGLALDLILVKLDVLNPNARTRGAPAVEGRRLWVCLAESRETELALTAK